MATTTNYSWTTPDDTALVKDGAAAIRTLGSSIDTTTKNLNPQTTTGALAFRSATSNVNTSLPIGTAGQLLRVNSGATAPEWVTLATGGMTQLATGTLSGASVALTSISGSYRHLQLVIRNFDPNVDGTLEILINGDSTANRYIDQTTASSSAQVFGKARIETGNMDATVVQNSMVINFYDYANTTTWKTGDRWAVGNNVTTTTSAFYEKGYFIYNQIGAITSLTLVSPGSFDGGTYFLFGLS